jgi:hypothetical protein
MSLKRIENSGPESIKAFGWTIQKGYVYRVIDKDEPGWVCSKTNSGIGYHGNDNPPCGADYLYGSDDGSELLVISCESDPEEIDTLEIFWLQPVNLSPGDHFHDGTWEVYVLDVDSDGETTIAGKC